MQLPTQESVDGRTGRGFPWALAAALLGSVAVAVLLGFSAPRFVASQTLVYLEKLRRATEGPPVDVMVIGASQTVAAIEPRTLEAALPPGTRVYNYGAPAMAPSGGEVLLRRYLAAHDPPRLLVFSFAVMMYEDRRGEFERFTLKDMLSPREVLLAAWSDRRPAYLLSWLSTRAPTVRYREGLRTGLGSLLLDAFPSLQETVRGWMGVPDHPVALYRFDWRYTKRSARNAALLAQLEKDGGWHSWKEDARGGRTVGGAPGWTEHGLPQSPGPFRLSPREAAALDRVLASCREHGIHVLIPGMPHAAWFSGALRAGDGARRMDEFWSQLADRRGVTVDGPPTPRYPSRLFSDSMHLNEQGAERFSRELAPVVARVYARLSD